jgi:hypothetical protein
MVGWDGIGLGYGSLIRCMVTVVAHYQDAASIRVGTGVHNNSGDATALVTVRFRRCQAAISPYLAQLEWS